MHHHITVPLGEAHTGDEHRADARRTSAASPRRHGFRTLAVLVAAAALAPAGALAQPTHDATTPANSRTATLHHDGTPGATPWSITFTNPLDRSRGPGAGAGLL
jgi:hypothetical protein